MADPIGDGDHSPRSRASCTAIPIGCCSSPYMSALSIAAFAFAGKWSGRDKRFRFQQAA